MRGSLLLLGAWLLLGIGNGRDNGTYNVPSLILVTVAVVLLSALVLAPARLPVGRPSPRQLAVAVLLAAAVFIPTNPVQEDTLLALVQARGVLMLAALLAGGALLFRRSRVLAACLVTLMAGVSGALTIIGDPAPDIDVWYLVRGAADSIVHGTNMYTDVWVDSPDITDAFPYLPATGLLLAPFRAVGLDVRWGLLLACLAAAAVVTRLAPRPVAPALAAMTFLSPGWLLLTNKAWTEPLLLLSLTAVFLAVDRGRTGWAVVALAVAISTKQHVFVILPVLACWPALGWRRVLLACVGGAAVCLPWFLAAPDAFLRDALFFNLELEPRTDSLSLFSLALAQGWRPPFVLVGLVTFAAIAVACRRATSASMTALSCAWVLAVFHLVNKQSFYNEWWLVIALAPVALAMAPSAVGEDVTQVRAEAVSAVA